MYAFLFSHMQLAEARANKQNKKSKLIFKTSATVSLMGKGIQLTTERMGNKLVVEWRGDSNTAPDFKTMKITISGSTTLGNGKVTVTVGGTKS